MDIPLRKPGTGTIDDIYWNTRFCLFYRTRKDLMEILIPYFQSGLENNEFCLWIIAEPLNYNLVRKQLKQSIDNIDVFIRSGQMEIVPHSDWYFNEKTELDLRRATLKLTDKMKKAVKNGFNAARFSCITGWLGKDEWQYFVESLRRDNDSMKITGWYQYTLIHSIPAVPQK
jgi:hypothetical protein